MNSAPVIKVTHLTKSYRQGERQIEVLSNLALTVQSGERVAIVGLSGSGKSTLLHLLAGLDQPDSGEVLVAGKSVFELSETELCSLRNKSLGFVYQFHHLLADFTAVENIAMPLMIAGVRRTKALQRATELLSKVHLTERAGHKPAQLSGGERQRVAIARALVNDPVCVLADEPTGNLDESSAAEVDALMLNLSEQMGTSFIVVTHNKALAQRLDRVLTLHNGQLT